MLVSIYYYHHHDYYYHHYYNITKNAKMKVRSLVGFIRLYSAVGVDVCIPK